MYAIGVGAGEACDLLILPFNPSFLSIIKITKANFSIRLDLFRMATLLTVRTNPS
jgi:hypothetical protein